MKIFDGEFFADSTVIVFKEYNKKEYDVFIGCKIKYNLRVPKCTFYKLSDLKDYIAGKALVGFNNQSFDNQVITKITRGVTNPIDIYDYSQKIIANANRNFREYYDDKLSFQYLDLFKINHYDNPARATSLKKLEFNYRRKKIMDLPFHHTSLLKNDKELEEIVRYCIEDVEVTEECYNNSKKAVKLRESLYNTYGNKYKGFNPMNLSDVKIGEELNLYKFCELTGTSPSYLRKYKPNYENLVIDFNECIPAYIKFNTPLFNELLHDIKTIKTNKTKGYQKTIFYKDNEITYGQGGIHNVCNPRLILSSDRYSIKTIDVGSQYPSNIIKRKLFPEHLGVQWVNNIEMTYQDRITKYKPFAKKDPTMAALSDVCKLQMNGGGLN